jgi:hypothetical protein
MHTHSADSLLLYFSFFFPILTRPSQTTTNHPAQLPPLLNTSTQVSYTFVRGHNIHFSINLLWILLFFVRKSIIFSFNIQMSILLLFLVYVFLLTYVLILLLFVKETCSMNV